MDVSSTCVSPAVRRSTATHSVHYTVHRAWLHPASPRPLPGVHGHRRSHWMSVKVVKRAGSGPHGGGTDRCLASAACCHARRQNRYRAIAPVTMRGPTLHRVKFWADLGLRSAFPGSTVELKRADRGWSSVSSGLGFTDGTSADSKWKRIVSAIGGSRGDDPRLDHHGWT